MGSEIQIQKRLVSMVEKVSLCIYGKRRTAHCESLLFSLQAYWLILYPFNRNKGSFNTQLLMHSVGTHLARKYKHLHIFKKISDFTKKCYFSYRLSHNHIKYSTQVI